MPKVIGVLATFDTKGEQAQYLREQLERLGSQALLVDLGVTGTSTPPGEVTREQVARAGGMPLAEAPAVEDEIVLRHLRQGGVERAPGRGRQNHIVECPARHDRLDRAAAPRAEQTREWDRRHASTVPRVAGASNRTAPRWLLG